MAAPTVLVVDPSPQTAARVEEALAESGYAIARATNGAEAEAVLDGEDIALVLASVAFPRGNGYDLARQVKARHPEAVVFLLCGGFEIYNADRAAEAGVAGRINRPVTVESLRRHLETALGPLGGEPEPLPDDAAAAVGPDEVQSSHREVTPLPVAPPAPPPARPAPGDERLATFLPRDWRTWPAVQVDPAIVGPAVERAVLEVLPEVVEAVLTKALESSAGFRDLVEAAVDEAVRARLPGIARRVVRERLAELESLGEDGT